MLLLKLHLDLQLLIDQRSLEMAERWIKVQHETQHQHARTMMKEDIGNQKLASLYFPKMIEAHEWGGAKSGCMRFEVG